MKYALLMYTDPDETKAMSTADFDEVMRKHEALRTELTESGELVGGDGLAFPEETRTLRLREGAIAVTDGPLVEAGEHMSAYYLIDCENRARAIAIGEELLDFHVTAVEVRQIHDSV
jgi:hypothetical protein